MPRRYVRFCGFYGNEFMNQVVPITDDETDIAVFLMREYFVGASLTIIKQIKGANHDNNKIEKQTRKAANIQ